MYSMTNNGIGFTRFVIESLRKMELMGNDSTVILTGSASLECARASPNYNNYFNGQSDIDVLIIIYEDVFFMDNIFQNNILNSFFNDSINVLNYRQQYGKGRNAINIKYIKEETFLKWTSLEKVHFRSYREKSLLFKKPFMKCYGLSDSIVIEYQENKVFNYYILNYNVEFKKHYFLIDIHSMILFGTIIFGGCSLSSIDSFHFFFKSLLSYPDEELFNLFKYFLNDKKSINYSELRFFIEKFTELDVSKVLQLLKEKGMISEIKGTIYEDSQLATICWARSDPKTVFDFMIKVNTYITHKKFILIVDDICPKILYNRTNEEQEKINQKYRTRFTNCIIYFSSEIFKATLTDNFMEEFIGMMKKISLNYYIDFLPEKKKSNIEFVKFEEFIHTFCELFLLDYGERILKIDTMIFGKFSQNVIFLAKERVFKNSKLNYIIIPHLKEGEMKSYLFNQPS